MAAESPLNILLVDDEQVVHQTIGEYLTECGLEFHHPSKGGWLNGFGSANTN